MNNSDAFYYIVDETRRTALNEQAKKFLTKFFGKGSSEVEKAWSSFDSGLQLLSFYHAILFWDHVTEYELKDKATALAVVSMLSTIEGFMPLSGNSERVTHFFEDYFSAEEQNILLSSFIFSKSYSLSHTNELPATHHLMFERSKTDSEFDDHDCSTSTEPPALCQCHEWLTKQEGMIRRQYTNLLARKLYSMRNSVIHDAAYVRFVHTEERPKDFAIWAHTLNDRFTVRKEPTKEMRFVMYATGLSKKDMSKLFKSALWKYFNAPMVTTQTNT